MNPADKRLAVRTEDHPLEYAKFEGVIPAGQYGAGTVMVWDLGIYKPLEERPPEEQLARGKIDIVLLGEKLRGAFTLVQIERRSMSSNRRDHWLLIKHRDAHADQSWDIESPWLGRSVLTGRGLKEIKDGKLTKAGFGRRGDRWRYIDRHERFPFRHRGSSFAILASINAERCVKINRDKSSAQRKGGTALGSLRSRGFLMWLGQHSFF